MTTEINRRQFLTLAALSPAIVGLSCRHAKIARARRTSAPARFFFTSQGKTALIQADGRHPRLLTRGLDHQGADHPRWLPPGPSPVAHRFSSRGTVGINYQ